MILMENRDTLWMVGQFIKETEHGNIWDFQGVFTSEEQAVKACRTPAYFVVPIALNQELPHETVVALGGYYPLHTK